MNRLKEDLLDSILVFLSLLKWCLLSIIAGASSGIFVSVFLILLKKGIVISKGINNYYIILPIGLFISAVIKHYFIKGDKHGGIIQALNLNKDINVNGIPIKLAAIWVTLVGGGSLGKESPCSMIGAGITSIIAKILKLDDIDKKKFIICGISAGVAAVFGAPVAGALFACEILFIGKLSYVVIFPCIISSYTSIFVLGLMGVALEKYPTFSNIMINTEKIFTVIIFSVMVGILSVLFINLIHLISKFFKNIKIYPPLKSLIASIILLLIVYISRSDAYLGIGGETIVKMVNGELINKAGFIYKAVSMSVTESGGGSGGIFTPILFTGSAFGNSFASILNENVALFSALGMVSFLSAVVNIPITSIILSVEYFGAGILPLSALSCIISYMVMGHKSIFPTQILKEPKTYSADIKRDTAVGELGKISYRRHKNYRF